MEKDMNQQICAIAYLRNTVDKCATVYINSWNE